MDKIGYYNEQCRFCGESFNGYGSHDCPPALDEAGQSALSAAAAWMKTFSRVPDRDVDAALYLAIQVYQRSKAVEPARQCYARRMAAAAKEVNRKSVQPAVRSKRVKRR
jgi:hypothetical protein